MRGWGLGLHFQYLLSYERLMGHSRTFVSQEESRGGAEEEKAHTESWEELTVVPGGREGPQCSPVWGTLLRAEKPQSGWRKMERQVLSWSGLLWGGRIRQKAGCQTNTEGEEG